MTDASIRDLLSRVSGAPSFPEAAEELVDWARRLTGGQAAMLRFREDDPDGDGWIPALFESGFGCRFLRDEMLIGAEECICGRVCRGCPEDQYPFFTAGGSFSWGRVQSIARDFPIASLGAIRGRCIAEGFDSVGVYPIVASGSPIGCLHVADPAPNKFDAHVDVLEQACRACGPLFLAFAADDRRSTLIKAVEEALMPEEPARVTGLDIAVAFTSATESAHLGGDFYDVLELADGDALLVVGDYSGKGIGAAGMAARARHAVATVAQRSTSLGALLAEAEAVLKSVLPPDRFVTLVACRYSPDGRLVGVTAGHPAPLMMESDGRSWELPLPHNPPLAAFDHPHFREGAADLHADQTLLLYTDGITDSRRDGRQFGVPGIAEVWRGAPQCSLDDLTGSLCRLSAEFHQEGLPGDDRLALAVRCARKGE